MSTDQKLDTKAQVNWCLERLQEAVANYHIEDIKAYAAMARMWNNKEK